MDLAKLYKKQISFTEWFEAINHSKTNEMRKEDNEKRERMEELGKIIDFPFDKATRFKAIDLVNKTPEFLDFLEKRGDELCALRLIPKEDSSLPKLRLRGKSIKDVYETWFKEQQIDASKYWADFCPHCNDYLWSTIFVVNSKGIFGEIIPGGHYQLTQGFYDNIKPITFSYDFERWYFERDDEKAITHIVSVISKLLVGDKEKQNLLSNQFNCRFTNNYLQGYFESVFSERYGLWFVDYNRILGSIYDGFSVVKKDNNAEIKGNTACKGKVQGRVKIIKAEEFENAFFNEGEILVSDMTTPMFVPIMQKAKAIITDKGGILSHAAIVSRELKVPCITGTENATILLKDGDLVEVDADKGVVRVL